MVIIVPKNITFAIGPHRPEPLSIIGITPIEAAADVRKMGAHTPFGTQQYGLVGRKMFGFAKLFSIVEHDDGVAIRMPISDMTPR